MMTQPIDPADPSQAALTADSHRPPDDAEVVYFDGRPTLRANQMKLGLWSILALALIALPILALYFHWSFWRWWLTVASLVIAAIIVAVPWLKLRAIRYRITNYRIDYERGLITKKIDTLELWHVEDIHFEQGLVDRMCNVGSITVVSRDASMPRLELHGIPNPRVIFEELKQRVIAVKRQRGVLKVDPG